MTASSEEPELKREKVRAVRTAVRGFSHIAPALIDQWATATSSSRSPTSSSSPASTQPKPRPMRLVDVDEGEARERLLVGNAVLDRMFGSDREPGLAERSSNLVAGMPGTYKSTLLLDALACICHRYGVATTLLQAEGEMPSRQVKEYALKFGIFRRYPRARELLWIVDVRTTAEALSMIDELEGTVYVLDSLSELCARERIRLQDGADLFTARCERSPKKPPRTGIHIAHGTKDGDMSGALDAEHRVDALFLFEFFDPITGETVPPKLQRGVFRVRQSKNRFGFKADAVCGGFAIRENKMPEPLEEADA